MATLQRSTKAAGNCELCDKWDKWDRQDGERIVNFELGTSCKLAPAGADKGSIYVEFEVPKNSLIQGGKENWYKIVSPTASRSQKYQVEKQGGEIPPKYRNLTPPILTK